MTSGVPEKTLILHKSPHSGALVGTMGGTDAGSGWLLEAQGWERVEVVPLSVAEDLADTIKRAMHEEDENCSLGRCPEFREALSRFRSFQHKKEGTDG